MTKYNKPSFLIVGAAKSGTTSLIKYLGQHPEIYIPNWPKEPRFFVSEAITKISKLDPLYKSIIKSSALDETTYFNLFQADKNIKMFGEASVHYLNHPDIAIPKIKKYIGDVPIFIILRNPVERLISNWKYLGDFLDLDTSLDLEKKRKQIGYNSFWFFKEQSLYSSKVKLYLDNFTKVKIIIFEEFVSNTSYEVQECFKFLNLSTFSGVNTKKVYNKTEAKNYISSKIPIPFLKNPYIFFMFHKIFQRVKWLRLKNYFKSKSLYKIDKLAIYNIFFEDIIKLEKILGLDLQRWKY